ncbi:MAG: hypothetical protein CNE97_03635 [alpha proteobacterium MED-G10]|nr:MAG: hypothetical protein CNE97_03635 [alpha proteobacterium MED-G10]|tara:strand:+ start:158 stop:529 length:372 start_codon:yes stop_codon:yes gene_type:complete
MANQLNVLGNKLELCSSDPLTGFFRDGCCKNSEGDVGQHNVCAVVDERFLTFSKNEGNDLITPRTEFQFPGLEPGDRWCLCTDRWIQAYKNGCAPKIILQATNEIVIKKIEIKILKKFALDLN